MKAKALFTLFLLPVLSFGQISPPEQNLQKYWHFRERLKNFVVPGEGPGGSLLSVGRESYYSHLDNLSAPTVKITSGFLNYDDETIRLAHYISMLALEYKMVKDHGLSNDLLNKTAQELAYSLQAFNRLDLKAEDYWNTYYSGPTCSYPFDPAKEFLRINHLNGFFIREDVPSDFTNDMINDNLVENHLNSSYFPVDDGRFVDADRIGCFLTGNVLTPGASFPFAPCDDFNGRYRGPTEESLDQAIQIMMAMAIVVRCVPADVYAYDYYGNAFDYFDMPVGIAEEAQRISFRVTSYMQAFEWKIENPVTCSCVKGVHWDEALGGVDPCKCQAGGADMQALAYGMAMADCRIQTATLGTNLGSQSDAMNYYCSNYRCELGCNPFTCYGTDGWLAASETYWNTHLKNNTVDDDVKPSTLAAISNVWGNDTDNSLYDRCNISSAMAKLGSKWHLPLLNKFLYGGTLGDVFFNEALYEGALNTSQCFSSHSSDEAEYNIWSNPAGLMISGVNDASFSSETNNLSYLFYFNLYNLYKPTYLTSSGVSYNYIDPSQLCEEHIYKSGMMYNINQDIPSEKIQFIESDQKGFHAANSINVSAGSDGTVYVIANDNDAQPWPLSQANITYEAGNEINLHAGFEAHEGAEFRATINPNLNALACSGIRSSAQNNNQQNNQSQSNMGKLSPEETDKIYSDLLYQEIQAQSNTKHLVNESINNELSIVPNPNNGSFQISITKNDFPVGVKEIKVYDIMGKTIWETGASANNIFTIDITSYSGGIYYVKCVNEFDEMEMKKLIKQ